MATIARGGWLVGVGLLLLTGCGDKLVEVKGEVTCDKLPLREGSISFEPEDRKGQSRGGIIKDGKYEKVMVSVGTHIVTIRAMIGNRGKLVPAMPGSTEMVEDVYPLPAHYHDKSTLKVEVTAGEVSSHDFQLKSK